MKSNPNTIVHTFTLALTRKQKNQLNRIWMEHGPQGGAIIMQPMLTFGPFYIQNPSAQCAVVDNGCFQSISAVLSKATRKQNTP